MTNRAILDLRGLVLHCYYGNRQNMSHYVRNSKGEKIATAAHAVNEFLDRYLIPVLSNHAPIDVIAVLEGTNANIRRRRLFDGYKNKDEQDAQDEIVVKEKAAAMEAVQKILLHMGCVLSKTPFCEADDTIAFLCQKLKGRKAVYTVDNDLLALINETTDVYIADRTNGQIVNKKSYNGIDLTLPNASRLVTLYKSMIGDSSDGYKGVPMFGIKAFEELFKAYELEGMLQLCDIVDTKNWEALEDAYQNDPDMKPLKKLLDNKQTWSECWNLAKLRPEWCELSFNEKIVKPQWAKRVPTKKALYNELRKLELEYRIEDFETLVVNDVWLADKHEWKAKKAQTLNELKRSKIVAFDWETYDSLENPAYREAKSDFVDVLSSRLTGGSFCYGNNLQHCFYMPVLHRDTANLPAEEILVPLEIASEKEIVAHNQMFEMAVVYKQFGIMFDEDNLPHDTAILASYVDENGEGGLKKLSKTWLNFEQTNYREVVPVGKDMRDISGKEVLKYGCDDSLVTAHMYVLFKIITECEQTWDFYQENERFFYQAHLEPYAKGIPVDLEKIQELSDNDDVSWKEYEDRLRELLTEHCSEINEKGFHNIWPEVRDFYEAKTKLKAKKNNAQQEFDFDELESKIAILKEEIRQKCKYEEFKPKKVSYAAKEISAAARSIGLAAIRSVRPEKLSDWAQSMQFQATENLPPGETRFTDIQARFVAAVQEAAETTIFALESILTEVNGLSQNLWEGTELNVGSPQQMALLMYGMLNLPIKVRNEIANKEGARSVFDLEGAPATNELAIRTWLIELEEDDWRREVLNLVLKLKAIKTRRSLYYKPYPLWRNPTTGRIHPSFRNCGTVTRRPSGSSPNFLQISKTKDDGRMRSTIMPQSWDNPEAEEEVIVSIDFTQQELALLAGFSKDENLLSCYTGPKETRKDIHSLTTTGIMNIIYEQERKSIRLTYEDYLALRKEKDEEGKRANNIRNQRGKPTNFLMVYGGSPIGLARKLVVPESLAEKIFDTFHKTYPGVMKRQDWVVKHAKKFGYTTTAFGNRKHCDSIFDKDRGRQAGAERQAINMEMQGTAADVAKIVLREYVKKKVAELTGSTLYCVVYDEIVASVPVSKIKLYVDMMTEIMSIKIPGTPITLCTDASFGPSWGQQYELEGDHSEENIAKILAAIKEKTKNEA